jgi:hypothetical protein
VSEKDAVGSAVVKRDAVVPVEAVRATAAGGDSCLVVEKRILRC